MQHWRGYYVNLHMEASTLDWKCLKMNSIWATVDSRNPCDSSKACSKKLRNEEEINEKFYKSFWAV
jgi:hypothetical protein